MRYCTVQVQYSSNGWIDVEVDVDVDVYVYGDSKHMLCVSLRL